MNSFNIPEMVKSKVEVSRRELLDKLFDDKQLKVVPRIWKVSVSIPSASMPEPVEDFK